MRIKNATFRDYIRRVNEAEEDTYTVRPKNRTELVRIIKATIKEKGPNCDLNFIDTSKITDMSWLFRGLPFDGDISEWDTSKVINMENMFADSKFNSNISKWDVRNVESMTSMFENSAFNQDISRWIPKNLRKADRMFAKSKFSKDLSKWSLSKKTFRTLEADMFKSSPLEKKTEFQPDIDE